MTTAKVKSIKATVVFPADAKPDIDPADPRIRIEMEGGLTVLAKVNAKAARKLREHTGTSVLQGRLVIDQGVLTLADAGFSFAPAPTPASSPQGEPKAV
jgi:hypothetical protein